MFSKASIIIKRLLGITAIVLGFIISPVSLAFAAVTLSKMDGTDYYLPAVIVFFICLALGIFLLLKGFLITSRVKRFKRYVKIISTNIFSMRIIASIISRSTDFVRKDMMKMIDKKYFIDAFIDHRTDDIYIGGRQNGDISAGYDDSYETVVCKACGAPGAVRKGDPGKCEYCGSAL